MGCVWAPSALAGTAGKSPYATTTGTHGYEVSVAAYSGDRVSIQASKGDASTNYLVEGNASATMMRANFGKLGVVRLRFEQTRKTRELNLPHHCHGKPERIRPGRWHGRLKFKGERRYTKVDVRKLPGEVYLPGDYKCSGGGGHPANPVSLSAQITTEPLTSFQAQKNNPGAKANFYASADDSLGDVEIHRSIAIGPRPPGTFDYDLGADHASVHPGGKITGSAVYDNGDWSGDLRAHFPGATIALTGADWTASLAHGF